jgi:peptidoglycan/xylan/chitin deacetylase (PgdA/CDA1 family)
MRRLLAAEVVALGAFAQVAPAATWLDQPTIRLMPRLKGVGRTGHVAITFDDGPDPRSTPYFLDELDRLGWSATFFVLGSMVRRAPTMLDEIAARGHEIGLHGDTHRSHLLMTPGAVRRDLEAGRDTLEDVLGRSPHRYRPPYGELSLGSVLAARRLGLRPILWSAWGKDWKRGETGESVTSTVLHRLQPGGTVLLHGSDSQSTPGSWHATLAALPLLAEHLESVVTVGPLAEHF